MIPYFLCFAWLDDKRELYLKDEEMYPDLHAIPQPTVDAVVESKQVAEDMVFEVVQTPSQSQKELPIQRSESKELNEYDDVKDNDVLTFKAIKKVLSKTGSYIYSMGLVNFFEYLIVNLLLLLHVDRH